MVLTESMSENVKISRSDAMSKVFRHSHFDAQNVEMSRAETTCANPFERWVWHQKNIPYFQTHSHFDAQNVEMSHAETVYFSLVFF